MFPLSLLDMQPFVKSLSSALHLLGFFSSERQAWGVTELAKRTGLHKSQVSRILRTFVTHGFIQKNPDNREYRLGRAFLLYASLIRSDDEIRRLARPYMEKLNGETQGTVFLKVREAGETVTIDRIESQHLLRLTQPVGLRLPLNATSSGKVFLAYMSVQEVRELFQQDGFRRFTVKTKVDLTKLDEEFVEIRRRGFAVSHEEYMLGTWGVAAPIFSSKRAVVATIGLGLPIVLFPKKRVVELGIAVRRAAERISVLLDAKPRRNNGSNHARLSVPIVNRTNTKKGSKNEERQRA